MSLGAQGNERLDGQAAAAAAGMENQIASALTQAADEVARMESLDEEQRSEIYAILSAIKSDTQVHQAITRALSRPADGQARA